MSENNDMQFINLSDDINQNDSSQDDMPFAIITDDSEGNNSEDVIPFVNITEVNENNSITNETPFSKVIKEVDNEKENYPEDKFAKGFPSWSVEPPQVVVRRKRK